MYSRDSGDETETNDHAGGHGPPGETGDERSPPGHPGGTTDRGSGSSPPHGHSHCERDGRDGDREPSDDDGAPPGRDYDRSPLVVTWEATQACSLACDHCRADAVEKRSSDELDAATVRDLIDGVARFDPSPVFVVSGGDPLERPDLFELLAYATDRVTTAVTPAPTPRLDCGTVERFADVGVHRMAISIDRATERAHDDFRGETGSFEAARRAARYAEEAGVPIQVNTTVTADTVEDLPAVADLVERLGAVAWEVFFLVPVGRGTELDGLDPARAGEVAAWLYDRTRDAPFRLVTVEAPFYRRVAHERAEDPGYVGSVRAGKGFVFVSHRGEVYPSGFLPQSVGSVRETPLPELYREAPLMRALRDVDRLTGPCGRCPYRQTCGGSRSRAYAVTGDPFASDPLCPFVTGEDETVPTESRVEL
jgi:radical SAM protein with 4Fe4S-binding SPASM domain